ncbi:MAG: Lpg1974 family pore-forming outer membrane protein [Planctomycetota bacterium]
MPRPLIQCTLLRSQKLLLSSMLLLGALSGIPECALGQEDMVIPMSNYNDLLSRIDSLEAQAHSNHQPSAVRKSTGISSSEGGVFASYELALLKPVYSNSPAFYSHDIVPGFDESATLTEFSYDIEASHRLELGYLCPSSNIGWRSRYWFFDSDDSKQSRSDVDVKIGVADDPDIAIDTVSASSADFYLAEARSALDVFDIEAISKRKIYRNSVTLAGGIRYASVEHGYFGRDILAGFTENLLQTQFNFRGLGPTLALQSRRQLGGSGFGWNIGTRGSLLFGNTDAVWERITIAGSSDSIRQDNNFRMLPVCEMQCGLDYRRMLGSSRLELGTGFEGQAWINGGSPLSGGQDGATDSDRIDTPFDEDLGFLGVFFRGAILY